MLGVTPKPFYAVNVVFAAGCKCLAMIQSVMFAQSFKRVVASERISVVHRSLPDMCHQFIGSYLLNYLGVNHPITLKKPENNAFPARPATSLPFSSTTKVCLVNFDLPFEFSRLKLRHMVDRLTHSVIYSCHRLIIDSQINGKTVGGLQLIKAGDDANLLSQLLKRF